MLRDSTGEDQRGLEAGSIFQQKEAVQWSFLTEEGPASSVQIKKGEGRVMASKVNEVICRQFGQSCAAQGGWTDEEDGRTDR